MLSFAAISEVAISATSGAPPGVVFLSGLSVTASGGALVPEIAVALTGQACTASQGTIGTEVPLLVPMEVVVSRGTMIPLIDVVPTGQSVTASPGTLTPHVQVALTGLSCTSSVGQFMPRLSGTTLTASRGTLVPEVSVVLTGHAMTVKSTSPGFVMSDSTHVNVGLLGYTPAISAGTATPAIAAGTAATTFTPNPVAVTSTASAQAFTNNIDFRQVQGVYVEGKYAIFGENHDGSGADWATVLATDFIAVDPLVRADATFGASFTTLNALLDLNPKFNGNSFQVFTGSSKTYSAAPRKWALGAQIGVGVEGNVALLRTRTEDRFLTYPQRTRQLAYQGLLDWDPATWRGPEVTTDIDNSLYESSGGVEDGPVNNSMGVVALRPTFDKTPLDDTSPKSNALVFYPALWNNGADNWVPAFVKVSLDQRTNVAASASVRFIGNEIQLRSFTGVTNLWAMQNGLVVTHSGYGDVAYLTYLASTSGAPRTPSYVGVIVMDLGTLEVFEHTVKPLGAAATTFTPLDSRYAAAPVPHRPLSETVRLSDGRSVTQFMLRDYVINLSWTQGTVRHPVVTPKDGPSSGGGSNYLARGVDTLEVRGDSVYHVLWRFNYGGSWTGTSINSAYRPYTNDVTSTSVTWTLASADTWSWNLSWGSSFTHYPAFYSGSHQGSQMWLYQSEYRINTATEALRGGQAWVDFWSAQNPVLSVEAEGRVGRLEPVITDCGISVTLTGHQIGVTASNGLISGENKTVALTGHQINANYTCPVASVNVTVPLVGYQMECAQGRMSLIGDPVEVKLTGLHMCMQMNTPSTLPPGTVQLAGFAMTASRGTMVPALAIPLTGQSCTASGGTLDASVPLLAGLQVTASGGALKPAIAVTPAGQVATAASGSLGVAMGVVLSGQSATASRGTLVPHVTVALTGHAMTASAGTITPTCGVTLTGQQATCAQGASAPGISVRMSSLAIVSASGAFVPLHTVNLASNLLTASKGNFVVFMARALSGQVMTVQQGAVGLSYDCNFTLGSVQARGQVGRLTTNLPTPAADVFLWANDARDDELFAVVSQLGS